MDQTWSDGPQETRRIAVDEQALEAGLAAPHASVVSTSWRSNLYSYRDSTIYQ